MQTLSLILIRCMRFNGCVSFNSMTCRHHDIYIAQQQQRNDQSCAHCRKTKQIMVKLCVKRIPEWIDGPGQRQRECKYHQAMANTGKTASARCSALAMHPADEDLVFFHDDAETRSQDHNIHTAAECQQNISLPIQFQKTFFKTAMDFHLDHHGSISKY